jgi:hypothetical protein
MNSKTRTLKQNLFPALSDLQTIPTHLYENTSNIQPLAEITSENVFGTLIPFSAHSASVETRCKPLVADPQPQSHSVQRKQCSLPTDLEMV